MEVGRIWVQLGEGNKYDKNKPRETLKELTKIFEKTRRRVIEEDISHLHPRAWMQIYTPTWRHTCACPREQEHHTYAHTQPAQVSDPMSVWPSHHFGTAGSTYASHCSLSFQNPGYFCRWVLSFLLCPTRIS